MNKTQVEIRGVEERIAGLGEGDGVRSEIERLEGKLRRLRDELPGHYQEIDGMRKDLHIQIQERDGALASAMSAFQNSEKRRLDFMKQQLATFVELEQKQLQVGAWMFL